MDDLNASLGGNRSMFQSSKPYCDYIGFVEPSGHRNIVRAETVTIMRKMVDGSYNLHIAGYSYAKTTSDLQAFQSLEEAFAWMDLLSVSTPLPDDGEGLDTGDVSESGLPKDQMGTPSEVVKTDATK